MGSQAMESAGTRRTRVVDSSDVVGVDWPKVFAALPKVTSRLYSLPIVAVVNHRVDVDARTIFLSSITLPIAERGYYVFPVGQAADSR
jgi:hypothetical protein